MVEAAGSLVAVGSAGASLSMHPSQGRCVRNDCAGSTAAIGGRQAFGGPPAAMQPLSSDNPRIHASQGSSLHGGSAHVGEHAS